MRTPLAAWVAGWVGLAIASSSTIVSAQVPTRASEPRLAVPRAEPVAQPTVQPTAPAAPDAAAPTAAASPDTTSPGGAAGAPVTQATGASGVTHLGGGAGGQQTSSTSYAADAARTYTAGRFSLLIEGKPVSFVKKLQGGTLVGAVGIDASRGGEGAKKQLTGTKVEEITAVVGIDKPLLDWVAQSWKGSSQPKNGSIVSADFNYKSMRKVDFSSAFITETTVPKLDGSSKGTGSFTVKIQPGSVQFSKGDGASIQPSIGPKQKSWLESNFRFEMDGLDGTRVASIESFTVRQTAAQVGDVREATKASGGVEFPNLKLSISQASFSTWWDWYNDFVVNHNADDQHEKNGAIVLLEPNMKDELGRINLFNCGIYRLASDSEANADKIVRFTAELYCERMELAIQNTGG